MHQREGGGFVDHTYAQGAECEQCMAQLLRIRARLQILMQDRVDHHRRDPLFQRSRVRGPLPTFFEAFSAHATAIAILPYSYSDTTSCTHTILVKYGRANIHTLRVI